MTLRAVGTLEMLFGLCHTFLFHSGVGYEKISFYADQCRLHRRTHGRRDDASLCADRSPCCRSRQGRQKSLGKDQEDQEEQSQKKQLSFAEHQRNKGRRLTGGPFFVTLTDTC